jgi:hypothetical protein
MLLPSYDNESLSLLAGVMCEAIRRTAVARATPFAEGERERVRERIAQSLFAAHDAGERMPEELLRAALDASASRPWSSIRTPLRTTTRSAALRNVRDNDRSGGARRRRLGKPTGS